MFSTHEQIAERHGGLVTEQNFETWRFEFSNTTRTKTNIDLKERLDTINSIQSFLKSVHLVSYSDRVFDLDRVRKITSAIIQKSVR